jgi:hypothetical protein
VAALAAAMYGFNPQFSRANCTYPDFNPQLALLAKALGREMEGRGLLKFFSKTVAGGEKVRAFTRYTYIYIYI